MKKHLFLFILMLLPMLASVDANASNNTEQEDSLYGEWWLVGWNDGGIYFEVDTNIVSHRHLSIEIPREGDVMAYSIVNEFCLGVLTLNGNEMSFDGFRITKMTGGSITENQFFEDHIPNIKSYQLEGNLLRLYYTDDDYFVFTSDFDDSEEHFYEWKNGLADPYIGEVTAMSDSEVEVNIINSTYYAELCSRTMPPTNDICRFARSDLADQSFEVGDRIAFRIVQFKRLKAENEREYQLKVESCKGSGTVTDRIGTIHYDSRVGWVITDDEVNEGEQDTYYFPLKDLAEEYLTEGQRVRFSGELYPAWIGWLVYSSKLITPSHSYYLSIDAFARYEPEVVDYRPFVEEGKVWKVGTVSGNPVQVVDYYYFYGDTIIGGKACKQMMCQRFVSPDYSDDSWAPEPSLTKVGAWYEEDKKVYFYDETKRSMVLKYDFSIADNGILKLIVDNFSDENFIIRPKLAGGMKGFKGVYRDVMTSGHIKNTTWLEGVGGTGGPTRNINPERVDKAEFLMSCGVGDEVIYYNDEYEDGATPAGARKNRFDFTHTIKEKPKARMRSEESQSLYGEYNDLQLGINLDLLDDAYQVSITNDSGKVVYEKPINAGSIVGLNIDISKYPEGNYTVTVENSDESFTGEFKAQLTGIEEVRSKKIEAKGHIYNLQGQRLNSLQKGLNIVNGRKIFVKD